MSYFEFTKQPASLQPKACLLHFCVLPDVHRRVTAHGIRPPQPHHPGDEPNNRGDDSEEEYDFEYSDDEEEETDVDLENRYYSAKALKTEDPRAAVEAFREVHEPRRLAY